MIFAGTPDAEHLPDAVSSERASRRDPCSAGGRHYELRWGAYRAYGAVFSLLTPPRALEARSRARPQISGQNSRPPCVPTEFIRTLMCVLATSQNTVAKTRGRPSAYQVLSAVLSLFNALLATNHGGGSAITVAASRFRIADMRGTTPRARPADGAPLAPQGFCASLSQTSARGVSLGPSS